MRPSGWGEQERQQRVSVEEKLEEIELSELQHGRM